MMGGTENMGKNVQWWEKEEETGEEGGVNITCSNQFDRHKIATYSPGW